ncbi:crossover junction endodeoxyribonuclease rusA, partial [Escherichia coli EC1870]
CADACGSAH